MRGGARTLFDRARRALPALNWEMQQLQSGLVALAEARPWTRVPPIALCLLGIWAAYWLVFPLLVALWVLSWLIRPLELRLRSLL